MENTKAKKWLDILLLIFKILLPLVILFFMIFFTAELVDVVKEDAANANVSGYFSGHGFLLLAIILVMGAVDIAVLITAGIFLTVSILYKNTEKRKRNIVSFAVICVLCPVSYGAMFLINSIVLAMFG